MEPFEDNVYEYGNNEGQDAALYDEATAVQAESIEEGYIFTGDARYLDPRPIVPMSNRIQSQPLDAQDQEMEPPTVVPPALPPRASHLSLENRVFEPSAVYSPSPSLRAFPTKLVVFETAVWVRICLFFYGIMLCVLLGLWGGHLSGQPIQDQRTSGTTSQSIVGGTGSVGFSGAVGQVAFFATDRLPEGWLLCNGQSVNASVYPALAAALTPATAVPDLISDGLYIRGGLTPGELQNQSTAANGLFGHSSSSEDPQKDTLFRYGADEEILPGQTAKYVYVSTWRSSYHGRMGFWPKDTNVAVNSTDAETRPPTIVLVPAICAFSV